MTQQNAAKRRHPLSAPRFKKGEAIYPPGMMTTIVIQDVHVFPPDLSGPNISYKLDSGEWVYEESLLRLLGELR